MTCKTHIIGKNSDKTRAILDDIVSDIENRLDVSIDFAINIRLHSTRKSFDEQLGRKTHDWEVGNTSPQDEIDILDKDAFEKQSSHSKEDFEKILKHEIAHVYIKQLARGKMVPMWLNEGLSMYLADQMGQYKNKGFFVEDNFVSKISTEYGWNKYSNYSAYNFACLFVEYLVKKYSLKKMAELLKNLKRNYSPKTFNESFRNLFKENLEDLEKEFIKNLN